MPNTVNAKKRLRQSKERRDRNRAVKSVIRTRIRQTREALGDGDLAKAEELARQVAKKVDQAAAHHVIHKNRAARIKSRLSAAIKKQKQGAAA